MVSLPTEHRRSCHHSPSAGVGHIATTTAAIIIIIIIIIIVVVVVVDDIRGEKLARYAASLCLAWSMLRFVCVCACVRVYPWVSV